MNTSPDPIPASASNPALAKAVAHLREAMPDLLAIYRFGSHGTTQQRSDSDLDLAILGRQPAEPIHRWNLAQQLAAIVGCDVDLVDLGSASVVMRAQVLSRGDRLFCADEARCGELEDLAYTEYARLNEERREILADIRQQGNVYGR